MPFVANGIESQEIEVEEKYPAFFTFTLPYEISTGNYILEFEYEKLSKMLPIYIEGIVRTNTIITKNAERFQLSPEVSYITRLNCGNCVWESVSGTNPSNENNSYFVGGSNHLMEVIMTTDAWKTYKKVRLSENYYYKADPRIDFTSDGRVVIAGLIGLININKSTPTIGGLYIQNENSGQDFDELVLEPGSSQDSRRILDYPVLAVDNKPSSKYSGNMYLFGHDVIRGSNWKIDSGEGLFTIRNEKSVEVKDLGKVIVESSIGPNGEIYALVGQKMGDFQHEHLLISLDGGKTFYPKKIGPVYIPAYGSVAMTSANTENRRSWGAPSGSQLAVDNNGNIYFAYHVPKKNECYWSFSDETQDYFDSHYGSDFDVFITSSQDRGDTWSTPVKINDDQSVGDQVTPSIATDNEGRLFAAFFDHRNNLDKPVFDIYVAASNDGGKTFTKNIKVNDIPIWNSIGGREPGDYFKTLSVGQTKIYISYPCQNTGVSNNNDSPNDSCISVLDKTRLLAVK